MDEQDDILPQGGEPAPNQDREGRLPFQPDSPDMNIEDRPDTDDPVQDVLDVESTLEAGADETSDDGEALLGRDLPGNEPEPFDSTVLPEIPDPSITDKAPVGFEDEFGGIDFSKDVGDEETPGRVPELEAVDEAGKALDDFGAAAEAFHAQNPEPNVPGDEADQPGFPGDNALKDFLDSDHRQKDLSSSILIEATRRIEEITSRLERSRL